MSAMSAIEPNVRMEALRRTAKIITGQFGISVSFSGNRADATRTHITVPALTENASAELIAKLIGFLDHETAHILDTDFDEARPFKDSDKRVLPLTNAIEDVRVNWKHGKRYRGVDLNVRLSNELVLNEIREAFNGNNMQPFSRMIILMMAYAYSRQENYEKAGEFYAENAGEFDEVIDFIGKNRIAEWINLPSTSSAYDEAKAILKMLDDEKERQEEEQSGEGEAGGADNGADNDDSNGDQNDDPKDKNQGSEDSGNSESCENSDGSEGSDGSDGSEDSDDSEGSDGSGSSGDKPEDSEDSDGSGGSDDAGEDEQGDDGDNSASGGKQDKSEGGEEHEEQGGQGASAGGKEDDGDEEGDDGDGASDGDEGSGDAERDDGDLRAKKENKIGTDNPAMTFCGHYEPSEIDDNAGLHAALAESIVSEASDLTGYRVFSTEFDRVIRPDGNDNEAKERYGRMITSVQNSVGAVSSVMTRTLLAQTRSTTIRCRSTGAISQSSVAALRSGQTNIFAQKRKALDLDTYVEIVVDHSGSMSGGKIYVATQTCIVLAEALNRVRVPFAITGFTTGTYEPPDMKEEEKERMRELDNISSYDPEYANFDRLEPIIEYTYKTADEPFMLMKHRIALMPSQYKGANADGDSLFNIARRVSARKEARKVIIVLSDGLPSVACGSNRKGSAEKRLKDIVGRIEKAPGMDIIGIGIATDETAKFYKKHVVVSNAEDLPGVALSQLKTALQGGR